MHSIVRKTAKNQRKHRQIIHNEIFRSSSMLKSLILSTTKCKCRAINFFLFDFLLRLFDFFLRLFDFLFHISSFRWLDFFQFFISNFLFSMRFRFRRKHLVQVKCTINDSFHIKFKTISFFRHQQNRNDEKIKWKKIATRSRNVQRNEKKTNKKTSKKQRIKREKTRIWR